MKKSIRIGKKTVSIWILTVVLAFIAGIVAASIIARIDISYIIKPFIEPEISESLSFEPNPLDLDLGTITAVLEDWKKFDAVSTLTIPETYEITATLDSSTTSDFDYLVVKFWFNSQEIDYTTTVLVSKSDFSETASLYAGTYDVDVAVTYRAKNVTSTGTIVVTLS